jgi:hypothetical protein
LRDFGKDFIPLRDALEKEPDLVLVPAGTPSLALLVKLRDAQSDNGPMGRPEVLLSASTSVTMAYESISGAVEEIVLAT